MEDQEMGVEYEEVEEVVHVDVPPFCRRQESRSLDLWVAALCLYAALSLTQRSSPAS